MGDLQVHRVRFFEYQPLAVNCLAYDKNTQRLAVSRSDGSVEIWSKPDNWYQEKVITVCDQRSVEGLAWLGSRLFSVGLQGYVEEYDLTVLQIKKQVSAASGAIWCITANSVDEQLAVGTEDGCVVLFDASGNDLHYLRPFDKLEGRIFCIAWHRAESIIVTGGVNNIRMWSTKSGHALRRILLGGQDTIVWCVAITANLTIISGDSRGKMSFFNGKQGTKIIAIQSHKADILTLAVNEDGTSVFCAGVDSTVAQFSFITPSGESGWRSWARTSTHTRHSHDVRASTVVEHFIITAGVDTGLIVSNITSGLKKYFKLQAIPSQSLVSVAKDVGLLLLRFPTCLELWRLGQGNSAEAEEDGDYLPLKSGQIKLALLKARKGESIACSAVSNDGTLIAFSDQEKLRLHRLKFTDLQSISPSIEISRIQLPSADNCFAAHRLAITPNNKLLLAATNAGSLQVWNVGDEKATLETAILPEAKHKYSFTNLAVTDKLAATSNTGGHVYIYTLKDSQVLYKLPTLHYQATALFFSQSSSSLLVAYSNHAVYEIDVSKKEYTTWCRKNSYRFPNQWLQQRGCLRGIYYQPTNSDKIFAHSEHNLLVIDKKQAMPESNYPLFPHRVEKHKDGESSSRPLTACTRYKFIVHSEFLEADKMVIVERTLRAIYDKLDEPLRRKKFGL